MKTLLFSGAAFAALVVSMPAHAQGMPKPNVQRQCGEIYKLVDAQSGSWLEVDSYDYGNQYNGSNPVAQCGEAAREIVLDCVNRSGAVVDSNMCGVGEIDDYEDRTGRRPNKPNSWQPKHTVVEFANLGSCPGDVEEPENTYAWKVVTPNDNGTCGTTEVTSVVTCIEVATGEDAWESRCDQASRPAPVTKTIESFSGCGYDYAVSEWQGEPSCGQVQQTRTVECEGPDGNIVPEANCARYFSPPFDPVPTSEYWSKGAFPWNIGSPNPAGNNIYIYRLPAACDMGSSEAMQSECDISYPFSGQGRHYIRPKEMRIHNDNRSCEPGHVDGDYVWNSPAYKPDETGMCGENTKSARVFCMLASTGVETDDSNCDPATKPLSTITFDDQSGCTEGVIVDYEPTPPEEEIVTPPPTTPTDPTVPTVPQSANAPQLDLGPCRYRSAGDGVYACGYGALGHGFGKGSNPSPFPQDLCSGNIIRGSATDPFNDMSTATTNAGRNWSVRPRILDVPGTQCIVNVRAMGYNDRNDTMWQSIYFSGPPTGRSGGLFISKKP